MNLLECSLEELYSQLEDCRKTLEEDPLIIDGDNLTQLRHDHIMECIEYECRS